MSEKQFTVMKKFDGSYVICDKGKMLVADDCCDLLNELNMEFEDCEKLLDSKDDFIHKFKRDIEELGISIKLFEDDIATKDKKIDEQQATIKQLKEENEQLRQELQKKQEEERLYANEILELREANKEFIQFKELGGDY